VTPEIGDILDDSHLPFVINEEGGWYFFSEYVIQKNGVWSVYIYYNAKLDITKVFWGGCDVIYPIPH
jgi:hypothetical protein